MTKHAFLMLTLAALLSYGQTAPARPQFEVASIKLNNGCQNNRNQDSLPTPGRLQVNCVTLQNLIQVAYGGIRAGKISAQQIRIAGAPGWMQSEFYSVAAKADGPVPVEVMISQMLPALLEERCQLKVHKEMREMPVYAMTVGKGGLKIQPAEAGSCTPLDLDHLPSGPPGAGQPNFCGMAQMRMDHGLMSFDTKGISMEDFAGRLSNQLDRPVIDKTGATGIFNIHLEYAPDRSMGMFAGRGGDAGKGGDAGRGDLPAQPSEPAGPTLFVSLEKQVGLKLSAEKGSMEYLVIDHIEKPTEN